MKYLFRYGFCVKTALGRRQKQPLQRCLFKVFFSKVRKSLKRTCEGVSFLVKLQVESLENFNDNT